LSRLVVGFVEGDFQKIRRVGIGFSIETGVETERRDGSVRFARRNLQTIAPPFDGKRQTSRFVSGKIDRAARDSFRSFDRLELPLAVLAIPLIAALNL